MSPPFQERAEAGHSPPLTPHLCALPTSEFVPTVFEDGRIEGEYTAKDDGNLLLSVPYDEGWNVTVNGTAAELTPAADKGLSSLNIQKGANRVVMTYKTVTHNFFRKLTTA